MTDTAKLLVIRGSLETVIAEGVSVLATTGLTPRQLLEEKQRMHRVYRDQEREIEQLLGKALGYPWYKDDQKNFPGATEEDGVCIGEHVTLTLVMEAAEKLTKLQERVKELEAHLDRLLNPPSGMMLNFDEWVSDARALAKHGEGV